MERKKKQTQPNPTLKRKLKNLSTPPPPRAFFIKNIG